MPSPLASLIAAEPSTNIPWLIMYIELLRNDLVLFRRAAFSSIGCSCFAGVRTYVACPLHAGVPMLFPGNLDLDILQTDLTTVSIVQSPSGEESKR